MKAALVFPPLADATQPYASLPALAAFLRGRGNHAVSLHDANLGFSLTLWTRRRLKTAAARIRKRLREMEDGPKPSGGAAEEYAALVGASLKAPLAAERIEGAVSALRRWDTFSSLERLDRAKRVLRDAAEVLEAESPLLRRRTPGFPPDAIRRLTRGRRANPFAAYLEEVTLREIQEERPGAVGISITYPSQVVPAVVLARLIRRHMPAVRVIFGGQIVSSWYSHLEGCPEVFDWCDYAIGYEGETALEALLTAIENGGSLEAVPNLAWREDGVVRTGPFAAEDIDALPTPDYSGLPLDRYLAPEPVFLLNTSRGCYWSRCAFCSVSPSMRSRFRRRDPRLVLDDIRTLQRRYSARSIALGDDCVPPATLRALARGLADAGIFWQCEVRFEPALTRALLEDLRQAGCRNLIFGLESYSERVLARMQKGIRKAEIPRILEDCRRTGIAFNLQLFFGFPGETKAEAGETLAFAANQLHGAATLSFGRFQLQHGSPVARDPQAFGIRIREGPGKLTIDMPYEPVPRHAGAMETELARRVLARTRLRSLPLNIDAHTLLYLARSGVAAMAAGYYVPRSGGPPEKEAAAGKWIRNPAQSFGAFRDWQNGASRRTLLYDYGLDRTVEISRLARWLLEQLEAPASTQDLVNRASAQAQEPAAVVAGAVTAAFEALWQSGLVRPAS